MERIIYLYRMSSDTGNAPCVYGMDGVTTLPTLSLACCKGGGVRQDKTPIKSGLRREIGRDADKINAGEKEVWLAALYEGHFLYGARLSRVVSMREYFSSEEFEGRMDRIYSVRKDAPIEAEYNYLTRRKNVNKDFHPEGDDTLRMRDELGKWVLLSDHFVYLGEESATVQTPDIIKDLFPDHRGRRYYNIDTTEGQLLMDYMTHLSQWPGKT